MLLHSEVEAGLSLKCQPWSYREFQESQGYIVRASSRNKKGSKTSPVCFVNLCDFERTERSDGCLLEVGRVELQRVTEIHCDN